VALEINVTVVPSTYVLAFDDLSHLKEDEHRKAFSVAALNFMKSVKTLTDDRAEILIPAEFIGQQGGRVWVNILDIIENMAHFTDSLYFLEEFEFSTKLRLGGYLYEIKFASDPIVFYLNFLAK
jgi:hypothetical protein